MRLNKQVRGNDTDLPHPGADLPDFCVVLLRTPPLLTHPTHTDQLRFLGSLAGRMQLTMAQAGYLLPVQQASLAEDRPSRQRSSGTLVWPRRPDPCLLTPVWSQPSPGQR